MNYTILEENLNSKKLDNIYLLYGEEKFLLENAIKKIKKNFGELLLGNNYILLDESTIDQLIPNIESPAFGYDKKLIIINDSKLFKKDGRKTSLSPIQNKILEYLTNNDEIINESCMIIFKENDIDKNEIFNLIDKKWTTCEFSLLKPNEIIPRIKKICSSYKVNMSDESIRYLIETSGSNMQNLINEIRKLIEYKKEGGLITNKDIDLLATKQIESIIFDLTDNLAIKNIAKALEILDNLIYQKEPLQKILITLYGHFKKLYFYNVALRENKDVVMSLNLKPNQTFLINKYKNQAKNYSEKTLKELLEKMVELDYMSKIGKIDIEIGLKSLLCNYCT